jgi:phosphatidyl-myo-inositol dimannoside synthase
VGSINIACFSVFSLRMNKVKKVLMLVSAAGTDGGIQRFNKTLIAACGQLDIQLTLYSFSDSSQTIAHLKALQADSTRVFAGAKARFAAAVLRAIWFGGYDLIVVGHVHLVSLVGALLAPHVGSSPKCLLIAHGAEVWGDIRGIRRQMLRRFSSILCVSRYTQTAIQRQAPELDDRRFIIFPNALSPDWKNRFSPDGDSAPAALPKASTSPFMLSVARLDSRERKKGLDTVIEALAKLADCNVHYVIAGPGDDAAFLRNVAGRCGVTDRVHVIGRVSDRELVDLYKRCLAFVLPSAQEGFGIVFLEAMFFGALVVAAEEKGILDVVKHNESGLLVPFGDVAALAITLDKVMAGSPEYDRIRRNARRAVIGDGEFAFDAFVRRSAEVLGVPPRESVSVHTAVIRD